MTPRIKIVGSIIIALCFLADLFHSDLVLPLVCLSMILLALYVCWLDYRSDRRVKKLERKECAELVKPLKQNHRP